MKSRKHHPFNLLVPGGVELHLNDTQAYTNVLYHNYHNHIIWIYYGAPIRSSSAVQSKIKVKQYN